MFLQRLLMAGALTLFAALSFVPVAAAQADPVYTGWFSNKAVGGYDPVAYFTEGKPVEGSTDFTTEYQDADFLFATQANLDAFLAEPTKYAPQYGGYCAWAIAHGKTAKGNPKNWAIVDGKLYLNINTKYQKIWEANQAAFITQANAEWPGIIGEDVAAAKRTAPAHGSLFSRTERFHR